MTSSGSCETTTGSNESLFDDADSNFESTHILDIVDDQLDIPDFESNEFAAISDLADQSSLFQVSFHDDSLELCRGPLSASAGNFPENARPHGELQQRLDTTWAMTNWQRANARAHAERNTWITGQNLIMEEIQGLLDGRNDWHLLVRSFGLEHQQAEEDQRWMNTREYEDFLDFVITLREIWAHGRDDLEMALLFVWPQPPPYTNSGTDALTVICDLTPHDPGIPIIVITTTRFRGDSETHDTTAHRVGHRATCLEIQETVGMTMICIHNAYCSCYIGMRRMEEPFPLFPAAGHSVTLLIDFSENFCGEEQEDFQEANHSTEENSQMQTRRAPVSSGSTSAVDEPLWLYGYCVGWSQPLRMWRAGYEGHDLERFVASQFAVYDPTATTADYTAFRVFPQPPDLIYANAKGFAVARRSDILAYLVPILADVVWTESGSGSESIPTGPATWRQTRLVDFELDRTSLLEQLDLGELCIREGHPCTLSLRGLPWMTHDTTLRRVVEGDYARVEIAIPHPRIPLFVQWQLLREGCALSDIPERAGEAARRRNGQDEAGRRNSSSNRTMPYDDEANTLMQRPKMEKTFYIYPLGTEEPFCERLRGYELQNPKQALHQKFLVSNPDWARFPGTFFEVKPQPLDLIRFGVTAFLQKEHQAPEGTSIAMFDIELFPLESHLDDWNLRAMREWREVSLVRRRTSRTSLLESLQLREYCEGRGSACRVLHRDEIWTDHLEERLIDDGVFLEIRLRPGDDHPLFCHNSPRQNGGDIAMDPSESSNGTLESDDSEDGSLLQAPTPKIRPSVGRLAQGRLPPPGNGPDRRVNFNPYVNFHSLENPGEVETKRDLSIDNPYINGFLTSDGDDGNYWMTNLCRDLRFERGEAEGISSQSYDAQSQKGQHPPLPIKLEDAIGDEYHPFDNQLAIECGLDLRHVETLRDLLNQHMTIPLFEMEGLTWKREALEWISLPIWDIQEAKSIHIYTDGSRQGEKCGASAVLFVFDGSQWFFGGFCQHRLEDGCSNYTAELYGSLLALKCAWIFGGFHYLRFFFTLIVWPQACWQKDVGKVHGTIQSIKPLELWHKSSSEISPSRFTINMKEDIEEIRGMRLQIA